MTHAVDLELKLCSNKMITRESMTKLVNDKISFNNDKFRISLPDPDRETLDIALKKDWELKYFGSINILVTSGVSENPIWKHLDEAQAYYIQNLSTNPYSKVKRELPNLTFWFETVFFPRCEAYIKARDEELYNIVCLKTEKQTNTESVPPQPGMR